MKCEQIKPSYYQFKITNKKGKSIDCDVFDIANAMGLSIEQFNALKYFRVKGDKDKIINDNDKAIQCLKCFGKKLKNGSKGVSR